MAHLHIPDGLLPLMVWVPALLLALVLLAISARGGEGDARRRLGYQSALGALVLAAMAIEIPLGPLEYHLSLIGPLGVLVGAAGGYQVVFIAVTILAFVGHGGFTVIGLNALVLGAGTALARPLYRAFAARMSAPGALAAATAGAQAVSGLLWVVVIVAAMQLRPGFAFEPLHGAHPLHAGRTMALGAVALPMWLLGIAIETLVAYGTGRFLARVRPDLLPTAGRTR